MSIRGSLYGGAGVSPRTFQEILQERKAEAKEKAQLKRIRDLKRIQEMKSKAGWSPLEIFPKEIWAMILQKLNPEDRGHMWDLHPVFHDLMQRSHLRDNLFPQILSKIKTTAFWKQEDYRLHKIPMPLVYNHELRKVCKSLRDAVDRFLEGKFMNDLRQELQIKCIYDRTLFQFQHPFEEIDEKLDEILNFIRSNPNSKTKPRFFSKSLAVAIHIDRHVINENVLQHFLVFGSKILEFLEECGNQFWHFELIANDIARTGVRPDMEDKLCIPFNMWIAHMSNLKWLTFRYICASSTGSCFDFKDFLNQSKIDTLERLDINIKSRAKRDTAAYVKTFLIAQPHIKVLCMDWDKQTHLPFSSLESLEAIHINWEHDFYRIQMVMMTTGLKKLSQSIKRMALSVKMEYDSIVPVFQFLQQFPSLEHLTLVVKDVTIGGGLRFLRLPQLKEFKLRIENPKIVKNAPIHFFFSLQFLLYSKDLHDLKLEFISIEVELLKGLLERKTKTENMLDLWGGWDDLTNSNIWQVFPYLECVVNSLFAVNDPNALTAQLKKYWKRKLAESYTISVNHNQEFEIQNN